MKGKHDDLIMAIAMALYVGENSFSQLHKADSMTKAMLDGWINSSNSTNEEPDYRKPQQNKPMFGLPGNTPSDTKEQYKQNAWLFGKIR